MLLEDLHVKKLELALAYLWKVGCKLSSFASGTQWYKFSTSSDTVLSQAAVVLSLPGNMLPCNKVKEFILTHASGLLQLTAQLSSCECRYMRSECVGRSWRPAPPPFSAGR